MEFVFEVHTNKDLQIIDRKTVGRLKKMMTTFEVMVNTTLPEIRVRLEEK